MDGEFISILPASASPWLRAVEQAGPTSSGFDVDVIRRARDPWRCPAHLLPFLAHQRSVDLWDDEWSDLKKRAVIASAPEDHRLKGTEEGLRRYLKIAEADLVSLRVPPAGFRMGRSMTVRERADWLAQYPELRVYRERRRSRLRGLVFGRSFLGGSGPHGRSFLAPDDAELFSVPQAFLVDRGVETKLVVARRQEVTRKVTVADAVEVRMPAPLRGIVLGRSFIRGRALHGRAFLVADDAASRVYSLRTQEEREVVRGSTLSVDVLRPGLEPIDVMSDVVFERRPLVGLVLGRTFLRRSFLVPDRAVDHIFTRTRLFDPRRPVPPRPGGGAVIGRDPIGVPLHTARIRVRIRQKLNAKEAILGRSAIRSFLMPRRTRAYDFAFQAIRSSKRHSDRIKVETRTVEPVRLGGALTIGSFAIGEFKGTI